MVLVHNRDDHKHVAYDDNRKHEVYDDSMVSCNVQVSH